MIAEAVPRSPDKPTGAAPSTLSKVTRLKRLFKVDRSPIVPTPSNLPLEATSPADNQRGSRGGSDALDSRERRASRRGSNPFSFGKTPQPIGNAPQSLNRDDNMFIGSNLHFGRRGSAIAKPTAIEPATSEALESRLSRVVRQHSLQAEQELGNWSSAAAGKGSINSVAQAAAAAAAATAPPPRSQGKRNSLSLASKEPTGGLRRLSLAGRSGITRGKGRGRLSEIEASAIDALNFTLAEEERGDVGGDPTAEAHMRRVSMSKAAVSLAQQLQITATVKPPQIAALLEQAARSSFRFASLPDSLIRLSISAMAEEPMVTREQIVVTEGSPLDRCLIITKGTFRTYSDAVGAAVTLDTLSSGSLFNEAALFVTPRDEETLATLHLQCVSEEGGELFSLSRAAYEVVTRRQLLTNDGFNTVEFLKTIPCMRRLTHEQQQAAASHLAQIDERFASAASLLKETTRPTRGVMPNVSYLVKTGTRTHAEAPTLRLPGHAVSSPFAPPSLAPPHVP